MQVVLLTSAGWAGYFKLSEHLRALAYGAGFRLLPTATSSRMPGDPGEFCTQHDPNIPYYSGRSREKRPKKRISVMCWVPLGGWVRSSHQAWLTAHNALFSQTFIKEREWQLQQILHINVTFLGLGASKGWWGGKAVRQPMENGSSAELSPSAIPAQPHSMSGKVLTFCSLPWIFWFLIPVPQTLLKSWEQPAGNGLEIVKPHHNRTTSHIHHPAAHKMFLMMLFANTLIEFQT